MFSEIPSHQAAINEINKFISTNKSGFVYIRGRRRVGKTTVLTQLKKKHKSDILYFTGVSDERDQKTLERFMLSWRDFNPQTSLQSLKESLLHWDLYFSEILSFAKKQKKNITIIFDEIQWLAKGQNGFIGLLKNAWLEWEKSGLIKVIVCGSSNKFFHEKTGGEEQILRGLRTHSDIWLYDISPGLLHRHYAPQWTMEQIIFSFFFLGGIPYYWNQMTERQNFIQCLNRTLFNSSSIFLDEVNELLRLEFNKAGVETVKKIIRAIGIHGANEAKIAVRSRLSQSTLNEAIQKLLDYKLIFEKQNPFAIKSKKNRGTVYYLKDFLLSSYSQILYPQRNIISKNIENQLILPHILEGKNKLYIPDYTGPSFERFIQLLIEQPRVESHIHSILGIDNISFDVCNFNQPELEIDLLIHETSDEALRIIECKWTQNPQLIYDEADKIQYKISKLKDLYNIKEPILSYIITNCNLKRASNCPVQIIQVKELFG